VDEQSSSNVKVLPGNTNFTLKQKRYKRRKVVAPRIKFWKSDIMATSSGVIKSSSNLVLDKNSNFKGFTGVNQTIQYKFFKKAKKKNGTYYACNKQQNVANKTHASFTSACQPNADYK